MPPKVSKIVIHMDDGGRFLLDVTKSAAMYKSLDGTPGSLAPKEERFCAEVIQLWMSYAGIHEQE